MSIEYNENEYIKLYRKMTSWEWYTDVNTKVLFLHCLIKANWKPGDWKGIHYERGQFITSLNSLALETGLTVKMVRTAMEHLISTGEIDSLRQDKGTTKCRIITVLHYDDYQDTGKTGASEGQDKGKTRARQGQQYKNIKNIKEDKEEKNIGPCYFSNDDLEDTFKEFMKMRNKIKKPMTDRAIDLMLKKLERMTTDPREQMKILEQSITHCWQDIYELKDENKAPAAKPKNQFGTFPQRNYTEDDIAAMERKKLLGG